MDQEQADWLATYCEEPVDPDQAICDPHHHLWDFPTDRYLLDELRADTGAGHDVVSTVFIECTAGYRETGPEELRPVGETEFVLAQAIESAETDGSEIKGIVGMADLTLGSSVAEVLEAHLEAGGGRFKGIRHATAHDPSPDVRRSHTRPAPGLMGDPSFAGDSPSSLTMISASMRGCTTHRSPSSSTWPMPTPTCSSCSITWVGRSASGPTPVGAKRCGPSGAGRSSSSPSVRT